MLRIRTFSLSLVFLAGCAGPESGFNPPSWPWPFSGVRPAQQQAVPASGSDSAFRDFNFDWDLSGDAEIMPLQVFDDGKRMWLQFPPEGAWPAVFERGEYGRRPLSYRHEPPYMVLDGIYAEIELRGGHLHGSVSRKAPRDIAPPPTQRLSQAVSESLKQETLQPPVPTRKASVPGTDMMTVPVAASSPASGETASLHEFESVSTMFLGMPVERYSVSPVDQTIRQALERWTKGAGWTFSSDHWAVDVDIPLVGEARFDTDFKSAVRELLRATEMGDRPLQPCFYSNKVLRVVPYAQPCDRSGGGRGLI